MDGVDPSKWYAPLNHSCDWEDLYNEPSDGEDFTNMSYHDDNSDDDSTDYKVEHRLLDKLL